MGKDDRVASEPGHITPTMFGADLGGPRLPYCAILSIGDHPPALDARPLVERTGVILHRKFIGGKEVERVVDGEVILKDGVPVGPGLVWKMMALREKIGSVGFWARRLRPWKGRTKTNAPPSY